MKAYIHLQFLFTSTQRHQQAVLNLFASLKSTNATTNTTQRQHMQEYQQKAGSTVE